jgi:hypothetical protein
MVLVSAVAAQLVFGFMSSFTCALGSFIIENVAVRACVRAIGAGPDLTLFIAVAATDRSHITSHNPIDPPPCRLRRRRQFLRAMSTSISSQLRAEERLDEAFMTILFCFSLSTVMTGAAFWALGKLQLGRSKCCVRLVGWLLKASDRPLPIACSMHHPTNRPYTHPHHPIIPNPTTNTHTVSSFVPQHVLLGCISGMGVFILVEGIGISTGIDWSWEFSVLLQQLAPGPFSKIAVTALLTAGLSLLKTRITHPILTPIYFFVIPLVFFSILHVFHIPLATARASGWLFSFETASGSDAMPEPSPLGIHDECRSFPGVLACLDPRRIAWDAVATQLFTILGVIFFSIIHVPVNVPALSVTAGVDADLNQELKVRCRVFDRWWWDWWGRMDGWMDVSSNGGGTDWMGGSMDGWMNI